MTRMSITPKLVLIMCDLLLVHVTHQVTGQENNNNNKGCQFQNNGCTYNILLQNPDNEQTAGRDCLESAKVIKLDRAQSDYGAKINDMETKFSFLKDAHESRIKELEGTVRELLGIDKTIQRVSNKDDDGMEVTRHSSVGSLMSNDVLMDKLETEFNKLRDEIKRKNEQLMDAQIKLNETSMRMHETQLQHFRTSKEMVKLENQLIMMSRERAVLKNQLKDKTYRLDLSAKKAKECEAKTTQQQDRILELFRSESTLKEDLMTAEWRMNKSIENHDLLKTKYNNMRDKHERTKTVLKIREKELIDCYSAKTSTFCGFEDPLICGFTHIQDTSDFFDWTHGKGKTPSGGTGPDADHTCKGAGGHYMFIEASSKAKNANAILYSPLYRGFKQQCVEFFYHMHGRNMGTLNVYAQARGDVLRSAWRAYGNQGNVWTRARLSIPKELAMAGYQIAFEGIADNGYMGDMAIDDVRVTDGACAGDYAAVRVEISPNSTAIIKHGARKLRRKLRKRKQSKKKNNESNNSSKNSNNNNNSDDNN